MCPPCCGTVWAPQGRVGFPWEAVLLQAGPCRRACQTCLAAAPQEPVAQAVLTSPGPGRQECPQESRSAPQGRVASQEWGLGAVPLCTARRLTASLAFSPHLLLFRGPARACGQVDAHLLLPCFTGKRRP